MSKPYRVEVFGKPGCDKCAVLKQRIDKLLAKEEWGDFDQIYHDLETVDGLVAFSEAECINPQRVPALLVSRRRDDSEQFEPVPNPAPGDNGKAGGTSRLYHYLGLQTDYSGKGHGVITPKMISAVLNEARA